MQRRGSDGVDRGTCVVGCEGWRFRADPGGCRRGMCLVTVDIVPGGLYSGVQGVSRCSGTRSAMESMFDGGDLSTVRVLESVEADILAEEWL